MSMLDICIILMMVFAGVLLLFGAMTAIFGMENKWGNRAFLCTAVLLIITTILKKMVSGTLRIIPSGLIPLIGMVLLIVFAYGILKK